MKAGVAISPDTPSTAITSEIGNLADMLLVMTVYPGSLARSYGYTLRLKAGLPGKGGQKFLDRCVPKVSELRARFPDKDIEVDGGVGPKTIGVCADAGMSMSRKPRGGKNLTYPLSHTKGATSLWLERPSSERRIRKRSSQPSSPLLIRFRTRSPQGYDMP